MGSFLMSCNVTKQAIQEGSKVMITPIVQSQGYYDVTFKNSDKTAHQATKSPCYANHLWEPIGFVLEGIAQDYGESHLVDSLFNRKSLLYFFQYVFTKSFHTNKGEGNTIHELEYNPKKVFSSKYKNLHPLICNNKNQDISDKVFLKIPFGEFIKLFDSLLELIDKQRVFLSDYRGNPCQLSFSLTLKSAYQSVIKHTHKYFPLERLFNYEKTFQEELDNYQKYFNKSDPDNERFLYSLFKIDGGEAINLHYFHVIHQACQKKATVSDFKLVLKELTDVIEFAQFQWGLQELNLCFIPSQYGGQDYQNEAGKLYEKIIKEVNKDTKEFLNQKYSED